MCHMDSMKNTRDSLPRAVHMQVVWILKDYHRLRREREEILFSTPHNDGQPKAGGTSDATAGKAVRMAALSARLEGIDRALHDVSARYTTKIARDDEECFDSLRAFDDYGYFCYVLYDPTTETEPCQRTWKYFRKVLTSIIANNLNLI